MQKEILIKNLITKLRTFYRKKNVPLHEPFFDVNEKKNLSKCIDSKFVSTKSSLVNKFGNKSRVGVEYAFLKYKSEEYIIKISKKGLDYLILRPSFIYGRLSNDNLIMNLIKKSKRNRPIEIHEPLDTKYNFIHVIDLVKALIFLLSKNKKKKYNIGSYNMISLKNLAKIITKKIFKIKLIINNKFINNYAAYINMDCDKLKKTGFKHTLLMSEGIALT